MREVKIHGAFRSGTNHAKALIEVNYDVRVIALNGGWKHAPVPALFNHGHGWPIVGVVRSPWSWLVSMWTYAQGNGARHIRGGTTWETFLTSPVTITHGPDPSVPDYRFASPPDYWNAMAANFLSLGERGHVMRHEDACRDPERACSAAAAALGLERRDGPFQTVDRRTKNMTDRDRSHVDDYVTDEPFDAAAELERTHDDAWSWRSRRAITRALDPALLEQLGY